MDFDFSFSTSTAQKKSGGDPLTIVLVADFGGRQNRGVHEPDLSGRPSHMIDVDNFDAVLAKVSPRLHLPVADQPGPEMKLEFSELDDFHPDQLYRQLAIFESLRDTRAGLLDAARYNETAARLRSGAEVPAPAGDSGESGDGEADMLERLLGRASDDSPAELAATPLVDRQGIDRFIHAIVSPHIATDNQDERDALVASVDTAVGDRMRAVLHHPDFQELESLWRSVHQLVVNLETDHDLQLVLIDISEAEVAADLAKAGGNPGGSGLAQRLARTGRENTGPGLLIAGYRFGRDARDLNVLAALGAIAAESGASVLGAADMALLGCSATSDLADPLVWTEPEAELGAAWQSLRRSAVARHIGLALPRILMRLPYGAGSDEIDAFKFEELAGPPEHAHYLWGHPAFAGALLIGQAFVQADGWSLSPGDVCDIEDLPMHIFDDNGDRAMLPCAETLMPERATDAILSRGLMPIASYKGRNQARWVRFQAIADPLVSLAGGWA